MRQFSLHSAISEMDLDRTSNLLNLSRLLLPWYLRIETELTARQTTPLGAPTPRLLQEVSKMAISINILHLR